MALLNKWAFRTSVVSSGVLRSDIERRLRGRSGLDGKADEADEYARCCSLVTYRRTLGRTGREGVMGIIVISEQGIGIVLFGRIGEAVGKRFRTTLSLSSSQIIYSHYLILSYRVRVQLVFYM